MAAVSIAYAEVLQEVIDTATVLAWILGAAVILAFLWRMEEYLSGKRR